MPKILTVQNAEINTASITIRTLQIEGRQVTLAVFRQLPIDDIINYDNTTLKGVGWGHVNYMIEGDPRYSGRTIHLVWQKGNELRRCLVHESRDPETFSFEAPPKENLPALWNEIAKLRIQVVDPELEQWRNHYISALKNAEASIKTYEDNRARWEIRHSQAQERHLYRVRWVERRNALVIPLFDLPQLFIAV